MPRSQFLNDSSYCRRQLVGSDIATCICNDQCGKADVIVGKTIADHAGGHPLSEFLSVNIQVVLTKS